MPGGRVAVRPPLPRTPGGCVAVRPPLPRTPGGHVAVKPPLPRTPGGRVAVLPPTPVRHLMSSPSPRKERGRVLAPGRPREHVLLFSVLLNLFCGHPVKTQTFYGH